MFNRLKKYFVAGILVVLPLSISIYILLIFFRFADGILGKFINNYIGEKLNFYIPGLGLVLAVLIILIVGFLVSHLFKKRIKTIDRFLGSLPFLKYIYPLLKQTLELIFSKEHAAFKKVVLVEFPRKGIWSVGFISGECFPEAELKTGSRLENVYVPLALSPATGFIILVPRDELIHLDTSVKEAMKLILTAGIINPGKEDKKDAF
ncbi:MAG: DUF502 domain-containing protein [Candidatus Omnitrophica bacterium]|nr:DUF502 domain-containing protein [Candidatus Omnitrophota bacterium]MDD5237545.1 DUF502 domain-containing protein [Candidatus Omnitrophota bacterium]